MGNVIRVNFKTEKTTRIKGLQEMNRKNSRILSFLEKRERERAEAFEFFEVSRYGKEISDLNNIADFIMFLYPERFNSLEKAEKFLRKYEADYIAWKKNYNSNIRR